MRRIVAVITVIVLIAVSVVFFVLRSPRRIVYAVAKRNPGVVFYVDTDDLIRPEGSTKWCRPGSGTVNSRIQPAS